MQELLEAQGSSLAKFPPMPMSEMAWSQLLGNCLIMEQRNYGQAEQQHMADEHVPTLNPDQCSAFDQIVQAMDTKSGQCFFFMALEEL
jgi:hypothetical protein